MRIGVVSDPHGCLAGLRVALDWLTAESADVVVCAGDVASFGPQPNECISLLAERGIPTVQGNSDCEILLPPVQEPDNDERAAQIIEIDNWCKAKLTPDSRMWLDTLPPVLFPSPDVLVLHGGLQGADQIVRADAVPDFPAKVNIVAAGHLHVPFINHTKDGVWVNAGSAGRSTDGDPRASLAVLDGSVGSWQAAIHRIPFDLDAAERAIRASGIPYAERMIETKHQACWW